MSEINWQTVKEYEDITFKYCEGVARIAFNRPEVRNAFRPKTVAELLDALIIAHEHQEFGVVLLTGEGPSPKDGGWAFCSGGDQRVRSSTGYKGEDGINRFNILDVQRQIRFMNKVVICVVPGWAVGGGHSLHVVCDMTIASKEHAVFKQTDADVASFDGGFGSAYLARQVGQKRAREIFFLGRDYSAQEAFEMGMVNAVVLYILTKTGTIYKYKSGQVVAWQSAKVAMAEARRLITSASYDLLFALDPTNKKIVIRNKLDGSLLVQYVLPTLSKIVDMAVSSDGKSIFVSDGQKIYRVDVKIQ